jgi:single-stranded DNA-binding protein
VGANTGDGVMEKGDKVFIDGKPYTCTWSSDEMTDEERYQSHMKAAEFMEQYGLSGDFQRALAQKYRRV